MLRREFLWNSLLRNDHQLSGDTKDIDFFIEMSIYYLADGQLMGTCIDSGAARLVIGMKQEK